MSIDHLEKAIYLATIAHQGQVDLGGKPYILHCLRVMMGMKTLEEKIVGVLHDVIEDTSVTPDELRRQGFDEHIIAAVTALTRQAGESYNAFIRRCRENEIARKVKAVDIIDNSVLDRIAAVSDTDRKRLAKYKKALKVLTAET